MNKYSHKVESKTLCDLPRSSMTLWQEAAEGAAEDENMTKCSNIFFPLRLWWKFLYVPWKMNTHHQLHLTDSKIIYQRLNRCRQIMRTTYYKHIRFKRITRNSEKNKETSWFPFTTKVNGGVRTWHYAMALWGVNPESGPFSNDKPSAFGWQNSLEVHCALFMLGPSILAH